MVFTVGPLVIHNHSCLIYTYIKEKLENTITFGDKSRLGRGDMTAKVKAAVYASQAGIPVVITMDNIVKVLRGQRIGTLFHRDAHMWVPSGELNALNLVIIRVYREVTKYFKFLIQGMDVHHGVFKNGPLKPNGQGAVWNEYSWKTRKAIVNEKKFTLFSDLTNLIKTTWVSFIFLKYRRGKYA